MLTEQERLSRFAKLRARLRRMLETDGVVIQNGEYISPLDPRHPQQIEWAEERRQVAARMEQLRKEHPELDDALNRLFPPAGRRPAQPVTPASTVSRSNHV